MTVERLAPDAILSIANVTSATLGNIQDDPDNPDANWIASNQGGAYSLRVSFPTPSGAPMQGAGLQEFRYFIRKDAAAGNAVTWEVRLFENSVEVASLGTGTVTSTTGEILSFTWDAALLATADGSGVEVWLTQTGGHTGKASDRRYLECGAVEWNAETAAVDVVSISDVTLGQFQFESPSVGQLHVVGISDVSLGQGQFEAPAITQLHSIGISDAQFGIPAFENPALSQVHVLGIGDATLGQFTFESPSVTELAVHVLDIGDVTLGQPVFENPSLSQLHSLSISDVGLGQPLFESPAITQKHGLSISDITLGQMQFEVPGLTQKHVLGIGGVNLAAPIFDEPSIGQLHILGISDILFGAPVFDSPAVSTDGNQGPPEPPAHNYSDSACRRALLFHLHHRG